MASDARALERSVTMRGAVLLGLGSILGTGVFVSLAIAAGVGGSLALPAVIIAALVAAANGLSSAQLAATYPVSGGTYEYGHRTIGPAAGFVAGWMFLCAKSASAATAALGAGAYILTIARFDDHVARIALAVGITALITLLVAGGMRRSERANRIIVSFTLLALGALFFRAAPEITLERLLPAFDGRDGIAALLESSALVFVAFTGYGRIATLGEEVRDPHSTIPRAIIVTLVVSLVLYAAVMAAGIGTLGAAGFAELTEGGGAPLARLAGIVGGAPLAALLTIGAITAMLGVLLNLVLGLSRVALAMARRRDLPSHLAAVDDDASPRASVYAIGVVVGLLALTGDVRTTWSFSAVTVLIYYALTNVAALRLPPQNRLYPRWIAVAGLAGCLALAAFVDPWIWLAAAALMLVGFLFRFLNRRQPSGTP